MRRPSHTISRHSHFAAEKALATLQSRPLPGLLPPVPLVLSPYPPANPPTPLPPPSAYPRLIKHLPAGFNDSALYDLFRPFGALASTRCPTHFGADTGMVEFWDEVDAQHAEEAMHCADIQGHNIAVQVYQPRRTSVGGAAEFSINAPAFVPSGAIYNFQPSSQVHTHQFLSHRLICVPVFASARKPVPKSEPRVRAWSRTTGSTCPRYWPWISQPQRLNRPLQSLLQGVFHSESSSGPTLN